MVKYDYEMNKILEVKLKVKPIMQLKLVSPIMTCIIFPCAVFCQDTKFLLLSMLSTTWKISFKHMGSAHVGKTEKL